MGSTFEQSAKIIAWNKMEDVIFNVQIPENNFLWQRFPLTFSNPKPVWL